MEQSDDILLTSNRYCTFTTCYYESSQSISNGLRTLVDRQQCIFNNYPPSRVLISHDRAYFFRVTINAIRIQDYTKVLEAKCYARKTSCSMTSVCRRFARTTFSIIYGYWLFFLRRDDYKRLRTGITIYAYKYLRRKLLSFEICTERAWRRWEYCGKVHSGLGRGRHL